MTPRIAALLGAAVLCVAAPVPAASQPAGQAMPGVAPRVESRVEANERPVLRVCQDPNNLPFSRRDLAGFENRIAALFAQELGWDIAYTWFPQRMGFIRNTLRAKEPGTDRFKCDLVTGVATGFDLGAVTRPYYRSTYAMAYVGGNGLDGVRTLDDLLALPLERRARLKLGVFGGSPVADWLLAHGMMGQVVSYQPQSGDAEQYPGQIVENDLAAGKVDIAFVWGPIAGYFAGRAPQHRIVAVPLASPPGSRFDFEIAMAVRFGDKELKQRIDGLIDSNRERIGAILAEYGVPLLDEQGRLIETDQAR
ncbi:quinoprotein dehydrogenase-associated putative ABC transporter substrate-binding protein [Pseudoduganella albidiflava]|uniref:Methanol oxidation protein n=1 Tax=Pseudoduganella albidiflava TaxID=321983 RepID=A0A411X6N4_9BURK|nr:quinoprotein dehydrogenase-associated putative ABC transporter substrate-binding protein [Pseudoduganella albidiflava]QBI04528.1 quinoprotein dehydrogenase-associated putative ABC transporter substrate-binding protein [Pseudoduganella albidiflava]GGY28045.1 methanol oxidation protein [Pseudoduganella albidiflava]